MSKIYIHVSNSCRQASTGNITFRDLNKAQGDADWYLALLAKTRCVTWTLENVPRLLRKYEGVYPTSRVYQMNEYCEIGQSRKRMVLSNIALNLPKYTGEVVTTRDILGSMKGWKGHEKYWQRNSYGDARSVDTPSFTVTDSDRGRTPCRCARTGGNVHRTHPRLARKSHAAIAKTGGGAIPTQHNRNPKAPACCVGCAATLFAACLSKAVFPYLSMGV